MTDATILYSALSSSRHSAPTNIIAAGMAIDLSPRAT